MARKQAVNLRTEAEPAAEPKAEGINFSSVLERG